MIQFITFIILALVSTLVGCDDSEFRTEREGVHQFADQTAPVCIMCVLPGTRPGQGVVYKFSHLQIRRPCSPTAPRYQAASTAT